MIRVYKLCVTLKRINMYTQADTHTHTNMRAWRTVTDKLVVKTGAVPNCLFDRQLNRISRNNGALNLFRVPRRVPERGVAG